jgi:hypothetical protein
MRTHAFALCLAVIVIAAFPCSAQERASTEAKPIGKFVLVTGTVTIEHTAPVAMLASLSTAPARAKVDDSVYIGDVINAAADGKAGIAFVDGTAFNISGNTRIAMDEFVYDPNGKANATVLNLTKGTFTLVAGQVAKTGTMKVETPVATMGIRGTTPHVEIADDGSVRFVTLIEEGKRKVENRRSGQPTKQRKADNQYRFKELDSGINIKLKICSGC